MSKARQLADNGAATPNRNMVINGAMNVAQRATSVTGIGASAGYFTCDRWAINVGGTATGGRLTMSQTADGPNGISANCIKLDCTTADTSIAADENLRLLTILEGQNIQRIGKGVAGAKQVTVSFYVKASAAFTFGCELYDLDNVRQITKLFTTTTDWNRIELTFPADVDDGSSPFDDDNSGSLRLHFWLHSGSNQTSGTLNSSSWANVTAANRAVGIDSFFSSTDNNFFITGVQLEVGSSATPFEQEDYNTTLQKCLRYYENNCDLGHFPVHDIAFGNTNSPFFMYGFIADNMRMNYEYQVEKRADPTATFYTVTGLGNGATENRWDFWTGNAWNQCDGATTSSEITSKGLVIAQAEADLETFKAYMVGGCFELDAEL